MTPVHVRSAKPDDHGTLAALEQRCFGAHAWSDAQLPDLQGSSNIVLLMGTPVQAFLIASVIVDEVELQRLGVVPECRRGSLGTVMMEALEHAARARGAVRLILEVAHTNAAAVGLYTGLGFQVEGRRKGYYSDGSDALLMSRSLESGA